ncbi:hypothetical protein K7X08_012315 [Anisodus acutangulus]|uniref:Peroxisomal membrane protein 2 n=1 Tax=Anisodus acutangulus TaxID=402998 RepID=A0A9Q1LB54_9SOLA|nr:hypothetical protein K7X08_012315 [Anisodus acutangulus]
MATINGLTSPQPFLSLPKPNPKPILSLPKPFKSQQFLSKGRNWALVVGSVSNETDVIPVQCTDTTDQKNGVVIGLEREVELGGGGDMDIIGFGNKGRLSFEGAGGFASSSSGVGGPNNGENKEEDMERLIDRAINATIVLAAGSFAITKLLTIDHDYWHGWTLFEILRYAPQHNWVAYEEALKRNPVLAKMVISGVVYSVGDWIAQCYEGKPLFDIDRGRMLRSGLVGFTLHGSLSHYYYQFCEALFPFEDWWVVPAKVAFDQTVWSAIWNSIYYTVLGILRLESPLAIFTELKATFFPMLTAGWKLWPFAHLITYGVVPVEQRLLWVDCVELIWVTILSTYSNEKSEARVSEAPVEAETQPPSIGPPQE